MRFTSTPVFTVFLHGDAHGCGRKGGEGGVKKEGSLIGEDKLFMSLQLVGKSSVKPSHSHICCNAAAACDQPCPTA